MSKLLLLLYLVLHFFLVSFVRASESVESVGISGSEAIESDDDYWADNDKTPPGFVGVTTYSNMMLQPREMPYASPNMNPNFSKNSRFSNASNRSSNTNRSKETPRSKNNNPLFKSSPTNTLKAKDVTRNRITNTVSIPENISSTLTATSTSTGASATTVNTPPVTAINSDTIAVTNTDATTSVGASAIATPVNKLSANTSATITDTTAVTNTAATTLQDVLMYFIVIIVLLYLIYCIYYLTLLKDIYRDREIKEKTTSDEGDEDYSEEEDNFEEVEADFSNFIE